VVDAETATRIIQWGEAVITPTSPSNGTTEESAASSTPTNGNDLPNLRVCTGRAVSHERVTVTLIPEVVRDLRRLQERTALSVTDIINRAVTLYEFIEAQLAAGHDMLIHERTGKVQEVRLR